MVRASASWAGPLPQSAIDSTARPPNTFCAAAMVRRISVNRAWAASAPQSGSPGSRTVRRYVTRPSSITVRSASSPNRSTSSRSCVERSVRARSNSDAAAQGRKISRLGLMFAVWQVWRICFKRSGATAAAKTLTGWSTARSAGRKSSGQSSSRALNSLSACMRTMSGSSSSGAGGNVSCRNSMLVRPRATSVSTRRMPRASRAAAICRPIEDSVTAAAPSAGASANENACSTTTCPPRADATTIRAFGGVPFQGE